MGISLKTVFKSILFLCFLIACAEVSSLILAQFFQQGGFSYSRSIAERESVGLTKPLEVEQALAGKLHVIHPYQGFVNNPKSPVSSEFQISNYGFMDDSTPLENVDQNTFVIGIFGGSVAWWFGEQGKNVLLGELKKVPGLENKTFRIVNTAIGAYKQPQQLSTLSYLLSQGVHFDLVINLDGFNEIALSPNQVDAANVNPFYPHSWHLLVKDVPDREYQSLIGRTVVLKELRKTLADYSLKFPLRYSSTVGTLWKVADQFLRLRIETSRARLNNQKVGTKEIPFSTSGPSYSYNTREQLFGDIAQVWAKSSKLMRDLVIAQGGEYIHLLQPNQYILDSKPMGDAEKKTALVLDANPSFFNVNVPPGYAALLKKASWLDEQKVHFFDLHMVFKSSSKPLYVDSCCHISAQGNEIIAAKAARLITPIIEANTRE